MPSFLFLPPTPVTKTQLPKSLPSSLFHSQKHIITIHITQYIQKHPLSPLIPPPPPYLGHHQGPQLTQPLTPNPYSLIFLHQLQKPHTHLFNLLLQILHQPPLTHSKPTTLHFKNTIIIITTNIPSQLLLQNLKHPPQITHHTHKPLIHTLH
ncbi:AAA family ATPase, partial [Staphylococcus epidermidis]|uniref:AAA family ATPase n=1 Tax=Staphylococcus epidermidis TaxID=1282 RepID=UPI0037D9BBF6